MADVLTKSYSCAKSCVRCDLRERIGREQESEDMPTHLSAFYRQSIVSLWTQGHNISSIVGILRAEGRETTRATVRKWIFRWEKRSGLEDKASCPTTCFTFTRLVFPASFDSSHLTAISLRLRGIFFSLHTILAGPVEL